MANLLPVVGGDSGNWGTKLNTYLTVDHNDDGTHKLTSSLVTDSVNTVGTSGATQTLPAASTAGINHVTLTANCTFTFPTAVSGHSFTLVLVQGGSGSYTVTWPGNVLWSGGTTPTLTTAVGSVDILSFFCSDGVNWYAFISGQDMQ